VSANLENSTDRILTIISDNGSNMIKAIKILNERAEESQVADENDLALEPGIHDSDDDEDSCDGNNQEVAGDETEDNVSSSEIEDDEDDVETKAMNHEEEQEHEDTFDENEERVVFYRRIKCMAHTIQLVVKKVYAHYDTLIVKSRRFVNRIRKSGPAVEKLHAMCGKVLVTDNLTRWNSTYFMIQRLLEVKPHVNDILTIVKADNLLVADWSKLEEVSSLLEPFAVQTDNLQSDSMSMSYAIPALLDLQCHLQTFPHCKSLAKALLIDIRSRFDFILNPEATDFTALPPVSCLLSPSVANVMLTPDMQPLCNAAKDYIIQQVNKT
jgi:hypothetical protein